MEKQMLGGLKVHVEGSQGSEGFGGLGVQAIGLWWLRDYRAKDCTHPRLTVRSSGQTQKAHML